MREFLRKIFNKIFRRKSKEIPTTILVPSFIAFMKTAEEVRIGDLVGVSKAKEKGLLLRPYKWSWKKRAIGIALKNAKAGENVLFQSYGIVKILEVNRNGCEN